jgi:hypothetical protein
MEAVARDHGDLVDLIIQLSKNCLVRDGTRRSSIDNLGNSGDSGNPNITF